MSGSALEGVGEMVQAFPVLLQPLAKPMALASERRCALRPIRNHLRETDVGGDAEALVDRAIHRERP
jgi:hypothetical protein